MTPTQQKAIKRALVLLESAHVSTDLVWERNDCCEALRAALAEQPARCTKCNYQHGHQIGCENNPLDIALKARAEQAIDAARSKT